MNPTPWGMLAVAALFVIVPIGVIASGVCSVIWPRWMWFLAEGWKFKNAEPSGCALVMTRLGGLFCIVGGTLFLLIVLGLIKFQ